MALRAKGDMVTGSATTNDESSDRKRNYTCMKGTSEDYETMIPKLAFNSNLSTMP